MNGQTVMNQTTTGTLMNMNHSDKPSFKKLLDGVASCYQREPLKKEALQFYFSALSRYSIKQVSHGLNCHATNLKNGQFFPMPADIARQIEGPEVTVEMVIASARMKKSPLGILAMLHIGHWDLNNQTTFYLKQRAEECILLLNDWKELSRTGGYSDHTIKTMLKYGVNPVEPLFPGLMQPEDPELLTNRVLHLSKPSKKPELISCDSSEDGGV